MASATASRPPADRARTLRGHLALVAAATTASWLALLTVAFNVAIVGQLRGQADDVLRTRASAAAATVRVGPGGRLSVLEPADDAGLDTGLWIYQGRRALERPAAGAGLQRIADRLAGRAERFTTTADPDPTRLYGRPVVDGGHQVGTVVTALRLDPYRGTARATLIGSVALAVLLLAGVYTVTRTLVGQALRPVGAMSAQAARWSRDGAARRFGGVHRPAELSALAANLDQLLDRMAAVLRHERQLTGQLSHELRTPLARIVAETEWLAARPRTPSQRAASLRAIAGSAAGMQQICDTLLSDARADTNRPEDRRTPLEVAGLLADRWATDHPDRPSVRVAGDRTAVQAPAALVERILVPLLDNAGRYARRRLRVECAAVPGGVRVAVADDGPGVPAEAADAIFEAGYRGDPSDGHAGAGLGLPLARRLARAAGGDLTLDTGAPGARFVVTLPSDT